MLFILSSDSFREMIDMNMKKTERGRVGLFLFLSSLLLFYKDSITRRRRGRNGKRGMAVLHFAEGPGNLMRVNSVSFANPFVNRLRYTALKGQRVRLEVHADGLQ